MGNSRRPARRASHSSTGAARQSDWVRELNQALGDESGSTINADHFSADNTEDPKPQVDVHAIFDLDIPAPCLPISSPSPSPTPPPPPPPPPGSPPFNEAERDHGFTDPFDDPPPSQSRHDHGFIDPFDDTAIWKTFAQYRSMQRMIRELGEEVETHQQTISLLKNEHVAEMKKVKEECAVELSELKEECGEVMRAAHDQQVATLRLEVENLENENVELKSEIAAVKEKIRKEREWGVTKIEGMGYALEEMMFELETRLADDKN